MAGLALTGATLGRRETAEASPATDAAPAAAPQAAPAAASLPWLTLSLPEAAFVTAAVDTLVPADALSPSGADLGLAVYIDRQLAGAWGSGARSYRQGPHLDGKPEQGSQSLLVPREQFRVGRVAAAAWIHRQFGRNLEDLAEPDRIAALQGVETALPDFFNLLLALTMEGLFADPMHGGNRDKAGWTMLGYPGLPATYRRDIVAYHGKHYPKPARSISDFT